MSSDDFSQIYGINLNLVEKLRKIPNFYNLIVIYLAYKNIKEEHIQEIEEVNDEMVIVQSEKREKLYTYDTREDDIKQKYLNKPRGGSRVPVFASRH